MHAYPVLGGIALVKRSIHRMTGITKHNDSNNILLILGPEIRRVGEQGTRAVIGPAKRIRRDLRALGEAQQSDLALRARIHPVLDGLGHGRHALGLGGGVIGKGGRVDDRLDGGVWDRVRHVAGDDADAAGPGVLACCAGDDHVQAVCAV